MTVETTQLGPDVWQNRVFTTAPPWVVFDYIADFEKHVDWERELLTVIVLTRQFSGIEGIGADMVARFSARWGPAFQGLPPEVRAAAGGSSGDRPGLFSSPDEIVRHLLEGHPSRGPGPTSLERLKAIIDGAGRGHVSQ